MTIQQWRVSDRLSKWRHWFQFHYPWHHSSSASRSDINRCNQILEDHDLVWFHTLDPADSLKFKDFRNSVVDLDDLNQVKYRLKLTVDKSLRLKIADHLLVYKWKRREQKAIQRFGKIIVCSEEDKAFLGNSDRIFVVPNGFEKPGEEPLWKPKKRPCLGFIGYLGYTPNRDGMRWFAERIWPRIRKEIPDTEMHLVGRYDSKSNFSHVEGFKHLGFVEDPADEFSEWSAMIVPLQFGGGTRVKILEAFTKMCPVISTTVGCHGLKVKDNNELIIRDDEDGFAQQCIRMIKNPQVGQHLAASAWLTYNELYSWDVIGNRLIDFLDLQVNKADF
ncbi:MAG: glycosyltransferase [Sedimentisphaerales bacterium]|nr:glycosyltransferase [Sedimentisphaerales bacterium]